MAEHFDVVILGGGPGGYAAALYGAAAGLHIAMVEEQRVGGTCLHQGCIPAKELLQTAEVLRTVAGREGVRRRGRPPTLDLRASQARKQQVIDRLTRGLETLLKGRKVTVVAGTGTLVAGSRTIRAGLGRHRAARRRGHHRDRVRAALAARLRLRRPAHAVVGPRAPGRRGPQPSGGHRRRRDRLRVRVVARRRRRRGHDPRGARRILPGADADASSAPCPRVHEARHQGAHRRPRHRHRGHPRAHGRLRGQRRLPQRRRGQGRRERRPIGPHRRHGLRELRDRARRAGFVVVDGNLRTNVAGVYAVGDVVATPQLAHVAFAEAIVAIKTMLGEPAPAIDYDKVPWGIYCHPRSRSAGSPRSRPPSAATTS